MDKDSRNVLARMSATEVRIIANKKGKSKLWKYFGFLATGSRDIETCDKKKPFFRLCIVMLPYSGNTTNFSTHLEHHHPAEYSSLLKESGKTSGSSSSTQVTLPTTLYTHLQPLPKTSSHHKELVNAVGCFISKDLSLLAVEGVGFRSLMEITEPHFSVPSRKYIIQTVIPSLYLQEIKRVETTLAQAEYCSFATDLWTAKYHNHSYISIS